MRTTLKRGIGRGANGNGHAILPPGSLSPVTLYRQLPPPSPGILKLVGKFFVFLGIVAVILVCGLVGGFYLWAHESAAALHGTSKADKATEQRLTSVPDAKHPAVALVIGYDHRAGDGSAPSRSDTMMLIRVDPVSKTISMLSLPRDLNVPIWCPTRTASGARNGPAQLDGNGRINSAYASCGAGGALETVRHLTGVPINYLISVNFLGFIAVANKLGGVWMDVDRRYYNKNVGGVTDYANIDLQPGYQLLNGSQALSFVRYRHTDSDVYRLARQQQFVSAMRERVRRSLGLTSLIGIINTIAHHHYIDVLGHFDLGTIGSYAKFAYTLPPGHVFQVKLTDVTNGPDFLLAASPSAIQSVVQDFLNPDVGASATQTAVALGRKLHKKFTLPPSHVTLAVLNGNGVAGSAANASYLLGQKDYRIVLPASGQPANAPTWNYFRSKVYYDPARAANGKTSGQQIAKLVGSTDVGSRPANLDTLCNGALECLVTGSTFHDQLAPVVIAPTPVRHPPYVRRDPGLTQSTLAGLKKRMPFRLQLPTRVERSSYLDTCCGDTPVRVYRLGGSPTVRLTFKTGSQEYWGIQETKWTGAPVLSDRSLTQNVGGRRYDLYYNGSHLHMVVLRSGGASYWVVNTLLDSLSNETMLSIARGFRPMTR
ncbi:MAG TPA: LCP family protein [Gaiellaceae bacterium]|nr:LCP family protein [Gaiellaceae bacterium]